MSCSYFSCSLWTSDSFFCCFSKVSLYASYVNTILHLAQNLLSGLFGSLQLGHCFGLKESDSFWSLLTIPKPLVNFYLIHYQRNVGISNACYNMETIRRTVVGDVLWRGQTCLLVHYASLCTDSMAFSIILWFSAYLQVVRLDYQVTSGKSDVCNFRRSYQYLLADADRIILNYINFHIGIGTFTHHLNCTNLATVSMGCVMVYSHILRRFYWSATCDDDFTHN